MNKMIKTPFGDINAHIKTTYHLNWFCGLDTLLSKVYERDVEILGGGKDTGHSIQLKKRKLDNFENACISSCKTKGYFNSNDIETIMTDLVNKDILPEGDYVVTIDW